MSDSDSDRSGSVADSAFIYKAQAAQKFGNSMGGPDFDRMSQRLEKDLGLGNDMESLLSMERGGSQVDPRPAPSIHPLLCCPATLLNAAVCTWNKRSRLHLIKPSNGSCSARFGELPAGSSNLGPGPVLYCTALVLLSVPSPEPSQ